MKSLRIAALVGCLGLLLWASPAWAGVTWTGDISPADPTTWTLATDGYVGWFSTGTLDITGGGAVSSNWA